MRENVLHVANLRIKVNKGNHAPFVTAHVKNVKITHFVNRIESRFQRGMTEKIVSLNRLAPSLQRLTCVRMQGRKRNKRTV